MYTLVVRARSVYTPQAYEDVHVKITVEDANDNYPKFQQDFYKVTVRENSVINRELLTVSIRIDTWQMLVRSCDFTTLGSEYYSLGGGRRGLGSQNFSWCV